MGRTLGCAIRNAKAIPPLVCRYDPADEQEARQSPLDLSHRKRSTPHQVQHFWTGTCFTFQPPFTHYASVLDFRGSTTHTRVLWDGCELINESR